MPFFKAAKGWHHKRWASNSNNKSTLLLILLLILALKCFMNRTKTNSIFRTLQSVFLYEIDFRFRCPFNVKLFLPSRLYLISYSLVLMHDSQLLLSFAICFYIRPSYQVFSDDTFHASNAGYSFPQHASDTISVSLSKNLEAVKDLKPPWKSCFTGILSRVLVAQDISSSACKQKAHERRPRGCCSRDQTDPTYAKGKWRHQVISGGVSAVNSYCCINRAETLFWAHCHSFCCWSVLRLLWRYLWRWRASQLMTQHLFRQVVYCGVLSRALLM